LDKKRKKKKKGTGGAPFAKQKDPREIQKKEREQYPRNEYWRIAFSRRIIKKIISCSFTRHFWKFLSKRSFLRDVNEKFQK
jgi:hypothetical protein